MFDRHGGADRAGGSLVCPVNATGAKTDRPSGRTLNRDSDITWDRRPTSAARPAPAGMAPAGANRTSRAVPGLSGNRRYIGEDDGTAGFNRWTRAENCLRSVQTIAAAARESGPGTSFIAVQRDVRRLVTEVPQPK